MYSFPVECEACDRKCIILHKYLKQNSTAELPFIIDGTANIEVWEEGKPYLAVGYFKLCTQQKE
jgi:hypothetical protein